MHKWWITFVVYQYLVELKKEEHKKSTNICAYVDNFGDIYILEQVNYKKLLTVIIDNLKGGYLIFQ